MASLKAALQDHLASYFKGSFRDYGPKVASKIAQDGKRPEGKEGEEEEAAEEELI